MSNDPKDEIGREEPTPNVIETLLSAISLLRTELSIVSSQTGVIATTVDALIRRNVVSLDQDITAVSHKLGWLFVPQEEYRSLLHLSDGLSPHEPGTLTVLEALVRPGDTVIDVGAHIGLLSLPVARLIGQGGRLLAIEPNARSAECLRRTLIGNGMETRTQVLEIAASDEDALVDYYIGANSMLGSLLMESEGQASTPVRAARIDSLVPDSIRVDLVKIDAEGFETKVVAGMERLIAANRDIFVIAEFGPIHLEKYGLNPDCWFDRFFRSGLDSFLCIEEGSGQCVRRAIADLKDVFSANLLFYAHDNSRKAEIERLQCKDGS